MNAKQQPEPPTTDPASVSDGSDSKPSATDKDVTGKSSTGIKPMGLQHTAPGGTMPDNAPSVGLATAELATAELTAQPSLMPGLQIGDFIIGEELGRGGMGTVYAADQPQIQKRAAIKVLSEEVAKQPGIAERFLGEARAVNRIGHPNIIDIFAFGELPDGRPYYVMERLEGQTLGDRLLDGFVPASEALHYVEQICDALQAAHNAQVVHRDLKPENIWIAKPRHGEPFIKLLDFGIAKLLDREEDTSLTQTGAFLGSAHFTSPEQIRGRDVDHRTDLYALGVILYELFTGTQPFDGDTFQELVAKHLLAPPPPPSSHRPMPAAIEQLILACLEKDPADRPGSASEVWTRLNEAANAPALAPRPARTNKTPTAASQAEEEAWQRKQQRASRWLAVGLIGIAATILAVAAQRFLGTELGTELGAEPDTEPAVRPVRIVNAPLPPASNEPSAAVRAPPPTPPEQPTATATAHSAAAIPKAVPAPDSKASANPRQVERRAKRAARRQARIHADDLIDPARADVPADVPAETDPQEATGSPASRVEKQGLVTDNPFQ